MHKNISKPNAIEKSLDILMAFVPGNPEMGTQEISERMGLHKATASRILLTLTRRGFLKQNPETKKFSLGRSALLIGKAVMKSIQNGLVSVAKPYADELNKKLNETIVIEELDGDSTILAYLVEGQQRHRIVGSLGERLPVYSAAGAKAILAFSDQKFVKRILSNSGEFEKFTPNTITEPQILIQQFHTIRLKGVAFDNEESDIGISAIGVPIFNHKNRPIAGVVVVGPAHRIKLCYDAEMVREAKQTAKKISTALMPV